MSRGKTEARRNELPFLCDSLFKSQEDYKAIEKSSRPKILTVLARFFIVLFCLTFLANQAHTAEDNVKFMGLAIAKLLPYTLNAVAWLSSVNETTTKQDVLFSTRLDAIETHLEQNTGFTKPDLSKESLPVVSAMLQAAKAKKNFTKSRDEMAEFIAGE